MANWGAQRGGAIGSLALNAGAAGAALFEVSSGADIENAVEALGEGRYLAAGASAFFATPGGKGAKLLKNAAGEIAERIGKHSVSIRLPNGIKRVDLKGRSHGGVETPHVQEYRYHRNPVNGRVNSSKLPVRPATWQDLREVERVLQDRN